MNQQAAIIQVPLSQLRLSTKNSRKRRSQETIAAVAESLKVHKQLQNLVVTAPNGSEYYDVDAGGTRLLAFQLLAKRGDIQTDHLVDCKVVDASNALEASTAENTIREAMHPADQFRAFKQMVEDGKSIEEVAGRFSVAPSVVTQRLKLANVHPDLFAIYEQGGMKLDQLQALALTDDTDAQRVAWHGTKGAKVQHDWQRRPDEIRKRITQKEVGPDNPLVTFVGADLYQNAGGAVRRDLFSSDVYFADKKLLDSLAAKKLDALSLAEKNAGWSWVEAFTELDYSDRHRYNRGPYEPKRRALSAEEQARYDAITKRTTEIEKLLDDEEYQDEGGVLFDEQESLIAEQEALDEKREQWLDEAKSKTGVLIYIDRHHGLQIQRGYLKPGQRVAKPQKKGSVKNAGAQTSQLSQDMVLRLEMHRAAAIREHIAARPAAALQLLLAHLLTELLSKDIGDELGIKAENRHRSADGLIRSKFPDLNHSPARKAIDARLATWKKAGLPDRSSDLPAWLAKLSEAKRLELLALVTALSLDTNSGSEGTALAVQFEVDMTKWWAPTPDTFIGQVPKAVLADAVADVAGKAAGEAVTALKKDGAMAEAAQKLAGTGWLPKPLRGAGYLLQKKAGSTAKPAAVVSTKPKAQAKPAPKRAAKKAAKKAAKVTPKKRAGGGR